MKTELEQQLKTSELSDEAKREIARAAEYAKKAHHGQKRKSGEDYIVHPMAVAAILLEWGMDADTIIGGLLHDTVEDTFVSLDDIESQFGLSAARLVDGVTKIGQVRLAAGSTTPDERSVENLRKLLLAMSQDIRVIMIKLADRLHNLRTLQHLPVEKQTRIAQESLMVFAPLADRLGMGELKSEIEDICFSFLYPAEFKNVQKLRDERLRAAQKDYAELIEYLGVHTKEVGISASITTRVKHLYSIHKKLRVKSDEIGTIYDIMAARVIVDEVKQCYEVLGIVHEKYKPLIYRIKDFIAVPKPNGYQSLHTTVLSPNGSIFEVQIRTRKMHEEAERGLAAHFFYDSQKASKSYAQKKASMLPKKLEWVGGLMEWQEGIGNGDFREDLIKDLFTDRIFIFSPLGDLYDLPDGATPVDFAFAVHSLLGYRARGAKVNGKIVNLDHRLSNRDIVEIIATKKETGPSRDWINFVVTAKAKNKIRAWYRKQDRSSNIEIGRELVGDELLRVKLPTIEHLTKEQKRLLLDQFGCKTMDEVLLAVGEGQIRPTSIIQKLTPTAKPHKKGRFLRKILSVSRDTASRVEIAGDQSMSYIFAQCCKPKPPVSIVARTSRDIGLIVHRADCQQIRSGDAQLLPARWFEPQTEVIYRMKIQANNRLSLLGDITAQAALDKLSITSISSSSKPRQKEVTIDMSVSVKDLSQLNQLMKRIEALTGIISVTKR